MKLLISIETFGTKFVLALSLIFLPLTVALGKSLKSDLPGTLNLNYIDNYSILL